MRVEDILKREDGSKVRIVVNLDMFRLEPQWRVDVSTCGYRKRTWQPVVSTNDYSYRSALSRDAYVLERQLNVVTPEEILAAKTKLWMQLKPV